MKLLFPLIPCLLVLSCNNNDNPPSPENPNPVAGPAAMTCSVSATYPHDTSSFTEGILFYKGDLFESTGEYGRSHLLQTDLKTGAIKRSVKLDDKYFGEGIVIVNDTIYQLTYRENAGFMYSVKDFKKIGEFTFSSPEGWGMTYNGKEIIASDGTNNLYFYQPGTFRLLRKLSVLQAGELAFNINELEFINGFIYANQWQSPYILKIDPDSGDVVARADLSNITNSIKSRFPFADFLNGIAYDETTKKTYVTGKNWPELYEVHFSQ